MADIQSEFIAEIFNKETNQPVGLGILVNDEKPTAGAGRARLYGWWAFAEDELPFAARPGSRLLSRRAVGSRLLRREICFLNSHEFSDVNAFC
jgi:hypothetical protein